jgi:acyl carrier protein
MMALASEGQVVQDIERQVIDIIAKKQKLDPAAVTVDSTFEQLGLDSLDAADLLFTVEDTFGIIVPDDAAQSMRTVRGVADAIRRLQAARGEAP